MRYKLESIALIGYEERILGKYPGLLDFNVKIEKRKNRIVPNSPDIWYDLYIEIADLEELDKLMVTLGHALIITRDSAGPKIFIQDDYFD